MPAPTPGATGPAGAPALAKGGSVVAPPSADPCLPPLDTLRRRASELTREMTAFCLDDTKKINKWQMAVITAKYRWRPAPSQPAAGGSCCGTDEAPPCSCF